MKSVEAAASFWESLTMHEWLVFPDFGGLAPGLNFAAGALAVVLVQCVIVAGRSLLAWRRASGHLEFPPHDPTRIWTELKQLRAACATSATNLESVVARFRQAAMAKMAERTGDADQLARLRSAFDEMAATIASLEQEKVELELVQEQLLLQLERQDGELGSRSAALATAEQTIALLQGLIGIPDRAPPPPPRRAAG
jgi:hypothetical protein